LTFHLTLYAQSAMRSLAWVLVLSFLFVKNPKHNR
jgi:hypothetical protein